MQSSRNCVLLAALAPVFAKCLVHSRCSVKVYPIMSELMLGIALFVEEPGSVFIFQMKIGLSAMEISFFQLIR